MTDNHIQKHVLCQNLNTIFEQGVLRQKTQIILISLFAKMLKAEKYSFGMLRSEKSL